MTDLIGSPRLPPEAVAALDGLPEHLRELFAARV